jgi:hypothetical protein
MTTDCGTVGFVRLLAFLSGHGRGYGSGRFRDDECAR